MKRLVYNSNQKCDDCECIKEKSNAKKLWRSVATIKGAAPVAHPSHNTHAHAHVDTNTSYK